jgi:hypothetical protein
MEMQQIIEMLARMDASMKANQEKADAHQRRMDAMHKKMARMDAWLTDTNDNRQETMACQEKTEARLEEEEPTSADMKTSQESTDADIEKTEPDSGMMQSVVEHQEVPREDATVMPVGEPRKRRRDRNLDARRRRKQQERAQIKDGCRKNLFAARRAAVAWRKTNVFRKILTHG